MEEVKLYLNIVHDFFAMEGEQYSDETVRITELHEK